MKQLAFTLVLSFALVSACSNGEDSNDATTGGQDGGGLPDAPAQADATIDAGRTDSGIPREDSGIVDAGTYYCATNNRVTVEGAEVVVGEASAPATRTGNIRADLSCIANPPEPDVFSVPIFIRGCLESTGAELNQAELDQIEVAVFPAKDQNGMSVDPSFDFATGLDRDDGLRARVTHEFDTSVAMTVCASRVQLNIGFNAPGAQALETEREYIVRIRTATAAPQLIVAPHYYFGVIARNDGLSGAPVDISLCTSQQCYLRYNFNISRAANLTALAQQAANPVPGSMNLRDGLGSGYALVETYDCGELPMEHAVAGFNPMPLNDGYYNDQMFDFNATESTALGLYAGIGFPGQSASSSTAIQAVAGIGAGRDSTCTEEFGGRAITVFPDSVSVIRSSAETVLHGR